MIMKAALRKWPVEPLSQQQQHFSTCAPRWQNNGRDTGSSRKPTVHSLIFNTSSEVKDKNSTESGEESGQNPQDISKAKNVQKDWTGFIRNTVDTFSANQKPSIGQFHPSAGSRMSNEFPFFNPSKFGPTWGPLAGRTVRVEDHRALGKSLGRLSNLVRNEDIWTTARLQRFHEQPKDRRRRLRIESQERQFVQGFRRLIALVKQARAKGY